MTLKASKQAHIHACKTKRKTVSAHALPTRSCGARGGRGDEREGPPDSHRRKQATHSSISAGEDDGEGRPGVVTRGTPSAMQSSAGHTPKQHIHTENSRPKRQRRGMGRGRHPHAPIRRHVRVRKRGFVERPRNILGCLRSRCGAPRPPVLDAKCAHAIRRHAVTERLREGKGRRKEKTCAGRRLCRSVQARHVSWRWLRLYATLLLPDIRSRHDSCSSLIQSARKSSSLIDTRS